MRILGWAQLPIILCSPDSNLLLFSCFLSCMSRDSDAFHCFFFLVFVVFLFMFTCQVVLLGMDILSALVSRLQERFRTQVGTGEQLHVDYLSSLNGENVDNVTHVDFQ